MIKTLFFYFLLLYVPFVAGQNIRTIHIETANASPLNMSKIAENTTIVVLESDPGGIQDIILTNEYLFIASVNSVVQYDMSGNLIRTINCEGFVTNNVTSDTKKKELYVPVGEIIKCYNYSGALRRKYVLKTSIAYCLFHNGDLWAQSYVFQSDKSTNYAINKVNLSTDKITTLPFEKKDIPNNLLIQRGAACLLTLYNDDMVASFEFDNVLYRIQQDKVSPFVQWDINPPAKTYGDKNPLRANGFIGDFLFINYRRDIQHYIYLENMKTGEKYNVNNFIDDVFHSNEISKIYFLNQHGYFAFVKDKSEIKGNSIGNIPLKNGPVIFIVKTK